MDLDEWEEHFAADQAGRPYYHNRTTGVTRWEEPEGHRLARVQLAAEMYAQPFTAVQQASFRLDGGPGTLLSPDTAPGAASSPGLTPLCNTLRRVLENIVNAPSQAKFRTLRKQNAAFAKVWTADTARVLLLECGFVERADDITLPLEADLGVARFVLARIQQAQAACEAAAASPSSSTQPQGYREGAARWQQSVHHCGHCGAFINDGSERVWTGRHDAPRGEFRYQCNQCASFSLCEKCWDQLNANQWTHHGGQHTFEHIHPVESRHNTTIHGSGPWGNFGGSISGRARERLRERTGM